MDVGITRSSKDHPIHLVTGLLVVTVLYSLMMFAIRVYVIGLT